MILSIKAAEKQLGFIILATLVVLVNIIGVNYSSFPENGQFIEVAVLTDFVLVIPFLYIWFFRQDMKRTLIRAIGLAALGIWGASLLIPESQHDLIRQISILKYVGIAVLLLIEVRIISSI